MKKFTFLTIVMLMVTMMLQAQNPMDYAGKAYPDSVAPYVPCQIIARNWDYGGDGVAFQYPWGAEYGKAGDVDVRPEDNLGVTTWPTDGREAHEQLTSFKAIGNEGGEENLAWVRYSVMVEETGTYEFTVQYVAGGYETDRLVTIDMGGEGAESDTIIDLVYNNSTTNWEHGIPADSSFIVDLTAGLHVITFTNHFQTDFDLVKFQIDMDTTDGEYAGSAYPDGVAPDAPAEIIARNWDMGGQGVAYNWLDAKGGDTSVRPDDNVSVVVWPDGGEEQLTGFKNGKWVKYSVNIPEEGEYTLNLTYIAGGNEPETRESRLITIDLDGPGKLSDGFIDLVYKNSTQGWADGTPVDTTFNVVFSKGVHAIKIWNRRSSDFDLVKLAVGIVDGVYTGTPYPNGIAPVIPDTILARNWDKGGEGIVYHYPFEEFGKAGDPDIRPEDMMGVSVWPEEGGEEQLTSFRAPDNDGSDSAWVKYTIEIPETGYYDFTISYVAYGSEPVDRENRLITIDFGGEGEMTDAYLELVYDNSTEGFWTGDGTPADTTFKVMLSEGIHVIKFTNKRNSDFNMVSFAFAEHLYEGTAYPDGVPPNMPGEVLARNWDIGGEDIAYGWPWGDSKAGNADPTIRPEDLMSITVWPAEGYEQLSGLKSPDNTDANAAWVRYTVNVPYAGDYDFTISYIAGGNEPIDRANRLVTIDLGGEGENSDGMIELVYNNSTDGWAHGDPADTTFAVTLTKGTHVIEIANHRASDFNMVKFAIEKTNYTGTPYPDGEPPVVPTEILAANWDNGGQGVAFNWPWGEGTKTGDLTWRPEDDMSVAVWPADTGYVQLTGFKNNAWVKYTVQVEEEGDYTLDIKYIFGGSEEDRLIKFDMGGEGMESDTIISFKYAKSTEGWAHGIPADTSFMVHLTPGIHVIKVQNPKGADFDLISFSITNTTASKVIEIGSDLFKVYPTLADQYVTIEMKEFSNNTIYMRNITGIVLREVKPNHEITRLNISDLVPGMYFITLDKATKRFIKQ